MDFARTLIPVLLTCILASTEVKGVGYGWPCKTSEECQAGIFNSVCNAKKKCSCPPGNGPDYKDSKAGCKNYPHRYSEPVKFGMDFYWTCMVVDPEVKELQWFRNGRDRCKPPSTWCSQENTTTDNKNGVKNSKLCLDEVIKNDSYTCQAVTSDGRTWTVSEIQVIVEPRYEETMRWISGITNSIYCLVYTPNIEVRLLRDGKDTCTSNSAWCSSSSPTAGIQDKSSRIFDILQLQGNHTFTCEAYRGNEKLAIMTINHILVDFIPKIHELTLLPYGPQPKGTEFFVVARFFYPQGKPVLRWLMELGEWKTLKDELRVLSKNEYESRTSLGPKRYTMEIVLEVSNANGSVQRHFKVIVNGAMSVHAVRIEGVLTLALAILLTVFRSTTAIVS